MHVIVRFMILFLLSLLPGVLTERHRDSKVPETTVARQPSFVKTRGLAATNCDSAGTITTHAGSSRVFRTAGS
jgi:hypothetical protein